MIRIVLSHIEQLLLHDYARMYDMDTFLSSFNAWTTSIYRMYGATTLEISVILANRRQLGLGDVMSSAEGGADDDGESLLPACYGTHYSGRYSTSNGPSDAINPPQDSGPATEIVQSIPRKKRRKKSKAKAKVKTYPEAISESNADMYLGDFV